MNRRKSKFVWLGLGIYLIVPFFAGVFSIGNKLDPGCIRSRFMSWFIQSATVRLMIQNQEWQLPSDELSDRGYILFMKPGIHSHTLTDEDGEDGLR